MSKHESDADGHHASSDIKPMLRCKSGYMEHEMNNNEIGVKDMSEEMPVIFVIESVMRTLKRHPHFLKSDSWDALLTEYGQKLIQLETLGRAWADDVRRQNTGDFFSRLKSVVLKVLEVAEGNYSPGIVGLEFFTDPIMCSYLGHLFFGFCADMDNEEDVVEAVRFIATCVDLPSRLQRLNLRFGKSDYDSVVEMEVRVIMRHLLLSWHASRVLPSSELGDAKTKRASQRQRFACTVMNAMLEAVGDYRFCVMLVFGPTLCEETHVLGPFLRQLRKTEQTENLSESSLRFLAAFDGETKTGDAITDDESKKQKTMMMMMMRVPVLSVRRINWESQSERVLLTGFDTRRELAELGSYLKVLLGKGHSLKAFRIFDLLTSQGEMWFPENSAALATLAGVEMMRHFARTAVRHPTGPICEIAALILSEYKLNEDVEETVSVMEEFGAEAEFRWTFEELRAEVVNRIRRTWREILESSSKNDDDDDHQQGNSWFAEGMVCLNVIRALMGYDNIRTQ
ncbi:unnamed protein product [Notodromas monacha]|uniref:Uncharacterized protein n=1 Tax=Notodromas monacha TaxID=399045 RepID=A0A7R9BT39_9CRUS|nr:unnamed protein product [Notodromas monacha]CAG0920906.1 unnamed protein product [Notodromas monacha]